MILPSFGQQRRWFVNGVQRQPSVNSRLILVLSGQLRASDRDQNTGQFKKTFLIPYDGASRTVLTSSTNRLILLQQDYNAFRYCNNNQFDVPPPFRGGQCSTAYRYSVTWYDPIDRREKTAILEKAGPLEAIRFDSGGFLKMGQQVIASGGERRIVAPRVHSIRRLDGKADNCGDLSVPQRYYCPENPKRVIALAPKMSERHYLSNNMLLRFNISANAQTRYRINIRV